MSFDVPVPPGGAFTIGFVAALGIECASLLRQRPRASMWRIEQSGPGLARAAAAAQRAIESDVGLLVSWGLAGGLRAAAAPGTIVLPRRVLPQGGEPILVDAAWHERLAALAAELPVDCGDLLTVPAALESPAAKRAAAAASGAVAVDMESAAVAEAATRARVPFVALRVVVDGLEDALPRGAEQWIDDRGNRRTTAALRAILEVTQWPALLTLATRYRIASATLDRLARALATPRLSGVDGAALPAGS